MTRALSNQEACAHVTSFLKSSFAPDVRFELTRESDTVYRVRATSNIDASITEGLENMRAARLRSLDGGDVVVKMISADDANEYRTRSASSNDPILRQGYLELAEDAGQL